MDGEILALSILVKFLKIENFNISMAEKCAICGAKIEETFLGKLKGGVVKIVKDKKTERFYACDECQKKHGDKTKEEIAKLA